MVPSDDVSSLRLSDVAVTRPCSLASVRPALGKVVKGDVLVVTKPMLSNPRELERDDIGRHFCVIDLDLAFVAIPISNPLHHYFLLWYISFMVPAMQAYNRVVRLAFLSVTTIEECE